MKLVKVRAKFAVEAQIWIQDETDQSQLEEAICQFELSDPRLTVELSNDVTDAVEVLEILEDEKEAEDDMTAAKDQKVN